MVMNQPLLKDEGSTARRGKLSALYESDDYYSRMMEEKLAQNDEIRELIAAQPDLQGKEKAAPLQEGAKTMLAVHTETDGKSKKGKRAFPTPNKPDPMPEELAFLFTRISPEQMMYMWRIYTLIFTAQCSCVVAYCAMLASGLDWYMATALFSVPMAMLMIQNVYILHDVIHGATFPPYEWQNYITHPFADLVSLPWSEIILEHNRHHASTVDLLIHGEFGWDPATWLYTLQEWTDKWYGWLTVPLVPLWHFVGASDTGALFAILWYCNFPDSQAGDKCNKDFWKKWAPNRLKHQAWLCCLWGSVWLLGTYPLGRPLSDGWRFLLPVTCAARAGFAMAWTVFTNINHSHAWNAFLAEDPDRKYPILSRVMAMVLGGRHRFNEMLFHDLHHAYPNGVGALSQRGRFHGWEKVHDAAAEVLHRGLWKQDTDGQEPAMQKHQKRRSAVMKERGPSVHLAKGSAV